MYKFLSELLSDKKEGAIFSCFGVWHLLYITIIFTAIILAILFLRNKHVNIKKKAVKIPVNCAFALYIMDFFMMPFAYGEIDLEKLPFHMCTAMCIMCFISVHSNFFASFKTQFALLGLISNIIYVIYPAGLSWYSISPFSYRIIQTILFHGLMTAYGILFLVFESPSLNFKTSYKDLAAIIAMTLWALLGNTLYSGTFGDYSHDFNWFFVIRDPFYILPQSMSKYIMPFIMIAVFFAADMIVYAIYLSAKKISSQKTNTKVKS